MNSFIRKILELTKKIFHHEWQANKSLEVRRKTNMIFIFTLIGIPVLLTFGIINLETGLFFTGLLDLVLGLLLSGNIYILIFKRKIKFAANFSLATYFIFLVLVSITEKEAHSGILLWLYIFSPIAIFFTGKMKGGILTILFTLYLGFIFFDDKLLNILPSSYSTPYAIRFILVNTIISIFSYFFESLRVKMGQELIETNKKLVEKANIAGKEEITAGILHNLGTALTSMGISVSAVEEEFSNLGLPGLLKLAELLEKNRDNTENFLQSEKGKKIPEYIRVLEGHHRHSEKQLGSRIFELKKKMNHVVKVFHIQKELSSVTNIKEPASIDSIISDTVKIKKEEFSGYNIDLELIRSNLAPGYFNRHRIMQILIHLLMNARSAVLESPKKKKYITVFAKKIDNNNLVIHVRDNGTGIDEKNLVKIFSPGYSTKKMNSGFGLHYAANAAVEINGKLTVTSDGPGLGADFVLMLPYQPVQ